MSNSRLVQRDVSTDRQSRNQRDLGKKFPEITNSAAALDVQDAIDGEIVALRSSRTLFPWPFVDPWRGWDGASAHRSKRNLYAAGHRI